MPLKGYEERAKRCGAACALWNVEVKPCKPAVMSVDQWCRPMDAGRAN